MINVSSVMNALFTQLSSNQTIVDSGINVDLNSVLNQDPNRMPWVGIYHGNVTINPLRMQITDPWVYVYNPRIVIQASNFAFNEQNGQVSNRLDETLDVVFTSINSIRTFVNCVYMMTNFEITPFDFIINNDDPILSYDMTLNIEKRIV